MTNKIIFKKVNFLNDFKNIKIKFKESFNKEISKEFYTWRYINPDQIYCYKAIHNKEIIAHIAFVKYETFDNKFFLARHSSFVDNNFRRKKIYTKLLNYCIGIFKKKNISFILTWPNKNNIYTNKYFEIKRLPKIKTYISKCKNNDKAKQIIKKLKKISQIMFYINNNSNNTLIIKNKEYFIWRYFKKKPTEIIFLHTLKNKRSVLLFNLDVKTGIYNLLEHIGDKNQYLNHIKMINKKFIFKFWTNSFIEKQFKLHKLQFNLLKKDIFYSFIIPLNKDIDYIDRSNINLSMGDTDVFIQKL